MRAKILVIDDESVTCRVVTFTLKSINIEVVSASSGAAGIALAEASPFDMAIVDINLPDFDGFEVIRRMKQVSHMQDVPMIVFTARSDPGDEQAASEVGAVGSLYKPFSTQELREMVLKQLGERP